MNLYDFGLEISRIREAANALEIKGCQNASQVVFITQTCDELIRAINEVVREQKEAASNSAPSKES